MSELEKHIERKAVLAASGLGWLVYKFSSPANRGVPDRVFMKDGRVVFIEFKTPKGRVTKLQEHEIERIRQAGVEAYVCRSVDEVLKILNKEA